MTEAVQFSCVILAAVSTRAQAAHDVSIPNQIARGQAFIKDRGWREAVPPLIIAGESRQNLVSLRDAELAIPEIGQMLDLAQSGRANLVILYDYNRLRGLLDQVARTLAAYRCQLYSLSQPVEPVAPAEFNPYTSDSSTMMVGMSQTFSHLQISDLRRKYQVGMPRRVENGLPMHAMPYGYRKPPGREWDASAAPIQIEDECEVLLRMRRDYLAGEAADEIAARLSAAGVPTRKGGRWTGGTVLQMLSNPFYAGYVIRNKSVTSTDPRTRETLRRKVPRRDWVLRAGQHVALWTPADYERLLEIRELRGQNMIGRPRTTHTFSALLVCGHCGRRLVAWKPVAKKVYQYRCRPSVAAPHGFMYDAETRVQLRPALAAAAKALRLQKPANKTNTAAELAAVESALKTLAERRLRYQRMAGAGNVTDDELAKLLAEVELEKAGHAARQAELIDLAGQGETRARTLTAVDALLARYDEVMRGDDARANMALHEVIERVTVARHEIISVILRS
jgi:hypothetical protein